jgi:RNA polymerase sigma-70 factor, ECF subfamily
MDDTLNDNELLQLEALRHGDERAFRQLFDAHYAFLLGVAFKYVGDKSVSEDLVQEIFVDLWCDRAKNVINTSARGYLRRATINRSLNHLKLHRRLIFNEPEAWTDLVDDEQQATESREYVDSMEQRMSHIIENLPERCRIVFELSRYERMSHREISEKLGISPKTIENQITKAMNTLRAAMLGKDKMSSIVIWLTYWCLST